MFLASCLLVLTIACASQAPVPPPASATPGESGENSQAELLRLEDRREFDRRALTEWASDPRPERRRRAAIAIARIGTATFEDLDGDGWQSENEPMAGTTLLLTLAADPDPKVREAAAFAFGETGDLRGVEALFSLATDRDEQVSARAAEAISKLAGSVPFTRYEALLSPDVPMPARRVAARFLFRFASDQASGSAALLLDSQDTVLRREAAYSLSRHTIPQARRRIEALLGEPDALTRAYGARALGRIASPSSLDALLQSAKEPHAWVRTNSLRALGDILDKAGDEISAEQVSEVAALAVELSSDPDTGTAATAIELAGKAGARDTAVKDRLGEIARSGSPWHRELATLWLVRTFGIEAIASASLDRPWMKIRALEGMTERPEGIGLRARFFEETNPSVRAAVVANIPEIPSQGDTALLRAAVGDPDPVVRAVAIGRVAETFPDDALEILRDAESGSRGDAMNDARLAAIDALAGLETPGKREWLSGLLEDGDPVARRVAAEHLSRLEGRKPQYTPLPVDRPLSDYEEVANWASRAHIASIELPRGEVRIALRGDEAPMTAWNFAQLAEKGYFEGTSFMRVVPNFVIQGGDPRNDMSGGPGYAIRDEINMIPYERGAVGMALSGPDTGGSQFFVAPSPQPHLDGGYTVFGHVISGRGTILDRVERGDRVNRVTVKESDWTQLEIDKVAGLPLPTVIGEMGTDRLTSIVPEYPERRAEYEPNADVVSYMASVVQPSDAVVVVLGTWCHDSQREVPRFLKIRDELERFGVSLPVRFIAVDREKKEPADLLAGLDVEMVATFIYYRDGQEIGRIVETPDGPLEDHLLRVIAGQ